MNVLAVFVSVFRTLKQNRNKTIIKLRRAGSLIMIYKKQLPWPVAKGGGSIRTVCEIRGVRRGQTPPPPKKKYEGPIQSCNM